MTRRHIGPITIGTILCLAFASSSAFAKSHAGSHHRVMDSATANAMAAPFVQPQQYTVQWYGSGMVGDGTAGWGCFGAK